jgi:electron transport complex protein RnfG
LSVTYKFTKPVIDERQREAERAALALIVPEADSFKEKTINDIEYYEAYEKGKFIAYCVKVTGTGYSGYIHIMVAVDKKGIIKGVEILEQHETPGLGDRIDKCKPGEKTPYFLAQFTGKDAKTVSLQNIDAITGSTISSKAVIDGINKGINEFFDKLGKQAK